MSDAPAPDSSRLEQVQKLFASARMATISSKGDVEHHAQRITRTAQIGGGSLSLATGRPRDPLWYWKRNNVPYDIWSDETGEEMRKVRELCRLLYITHPLLGSAIDVYSKYPLAGMEIVCPKDKSIATFYTELFMDDLNYEEYLVDVGREHWLVGEAFPLASFNELTGVWDSDDLMLPEDVEVIKTPFSNDPRFLMALPWMIRRILNDRAPQMEYRQLIENYPELLAYNFSDLAQFGHRDERFLMPISGKLMQHVKRKGDSFHPRGIPIMMRAFRAVAQEEMLNAAQDSISQRLYTPLILARIGASATDLGTTTPWIPTQGDLDAFVEDVNLALSADFRLIVTHFAAQMQNVFGRESMPNLQQDFERLIERQLQAFGMSKTMLSGASGGETYAADALNRDLMTQLLIEYQRMMRKFFRKRAEIVAEAQGHYDFTIKGGRPVPVMETVQETDEQTGEIRFIERPKLLLPDLRIRAMNMRDEKQFGEFLASARQEGIPISQKTRLVNVPIDLDEEIDAVVQEQVDQAVRAEEVRKRQYQELKRRGLPIPEELRKDYEPRVSGAEHGDAINEAATAQVGEMLGLPAAGESTDTGGPEPLPSLGTTAPDASALVPPTDGADGESESSDALTRENRQRPPESDEQREGMPKDSMIAAWAYADRDLNWGEVHDGDFARYSFHPDEFRRTAQVAKNDDGVETDDPGNPDALIRDEVDDSLSDGEAISSTPLDLPVLGSYHMRHIGKQRRPEAFYRRVD